MDAIQSKSFLLKIYFPKHDFQKLEDQIIKLTYKDFKLFGILKMPKRLFRSYYLVVFDEQNSAKRKIDRKEKDAVKYFIGLINKKN